MYNEELKTKFIRERTTSLDVARGYESIFKRIGKFESQFDSDYSTWDCDRLNDVLKNIVGLRKSTNLVQLSMLKEYVKWRINNDIDGTNDYIFSINDVGVDKFKEVTVPNPGYLQRYLDILFDPESMKTNSNTTRFYFWMAFSGADEEDIFKIRRSDVDFNKMVIKNTEKDILYPIYIESLNCMHNCADLNSFLYTNKNYTNPIIRKRVDGDILIRGVRSIPGIKTMRADISKKVKALYSETKMRPTYSSIRLSGIFYRAYYDEMSGIEPDFKPIVLNDIDGKEYALESRRLTENQLIKKKIKEYNDDYIRWKMAWTYK